MTHKSEILALIGIAGFVGPIGIEVTLGSNGMLTMELLRCVWLPSTITGMLGFLGMLVRSDNPGQLDQTDMDSQTQVPQDNREMTLGAGAGSPANSKATTTILQQAMAEAGIPMTTENWMAVTRMNASSRRLMRGPAINELREYAHRGE